MKTNAAGCLWRVVFFAVLLTYIMMGGEFFAAGSGKFAYMYSTGENVFSFHGESIKSSLVNVGKYCSTIRIV